MKHNFLTVSFLSFLTVILCLSSCKVDDNMPDKLRKAIFKINADEKMSDQDIYLVIPSTGCDKCIEEAKKFFAKDVARGNSRVKFVFTEISSMKLFKLEMGDKIMNNDHVLLDTNMEMYRAGVRSIYPLIFIPFEDGVVEVTPNNYESLLKLSTLSRS